MFRFFCRDKEPIIAVPVIALSVLFGVVAGFIGGLLAVNYLYPTATAEAPIRLFSHSTPRIGEDVVYPSASVEAAARAQVLFFQAGTMGQSQFFWPNKASAAGVVLTSDGWLISYGDWPENNRSGTIVAVISAKSYPVVQFVTDSGSGVTFLKVDATNLPVIGFDESTGLALGDPVFAYDPTLGLRRLDVVGYSPLPATDASGMILSSDKLDKRLLLPTAEDALPGTMILDRQGQVVAIFAGNNQVGSSAILVKDFGDQLEPVVREQRANRPYLGVHYVDLSRLIGGLNRRGDQQKGALLAPNASGSQPAVIKGSPADKVGLRSGDLILAVNGEKISIRRSLSDLISDYRAGDELTLTVLRGAFSGGFNWRSLDRPGLETEVIIELERLP